MLRSFALALSTRGTGVKMVILADSKSFKMKFLRLCISWNISYKLEWGALLVPTWMMLSCVFLRCDTTKNFITWIVAPGKVLTFINLFCDIFDFLRPDNMELVTMRVGSFHSCWDCVVVELQQYITLIFSIFRL